MQSGIALWPGSTTRAAARITRRVGGDDDVRVGRDVDERLRHRAKIAHSVVDDGDVGHCGSCRRTSARPRHERGLSRCDC